MNTPLPRTGLQLRSKIDRNGQLELSLVSVDTPAPASDEVVIQVQAAPINPSDIGLLFGAAVFAIFNGPWLVAASIFLGSVYLVYLGIRLIVQSAGQASPVAAMPQVWEMPLTLTLSP